MIRPSCRAPPVALPRDLHAHGPADVCLVTSSAR